MKKPTVRRRIGQPKDATRSRVSNGSALFIAVDQRSAWARCFRDVLAEIVSDLGGADLLSEAQKQLARRAATIAITCEHEEAKVARGEEINLEVYGQLTDRLGRCLARLGTNALKRVAKDITPSLDSYLRTRQQTDPEDLEAAGEAAE